MGLRVVGPPPPTETFIGAKLCQAKQKARPDGLMKRERKKIK
jgi:hypothetical protein